MKEKRTGILTLSSAQNYGAVLQSYSLMIFLNDNYGHTEIIDYIPKFIIGRYNLIKIDNTSIIKFLLSILKGIVKLPIPLITRVRFNSFRRKYCVFSKKKYVRIIDEDKYDQYIVGSDQVFNLKLTSNELTFFLPFVSESKKKATYAASIGLDSISTDLENVYRDRLSDFSNISIREKNGAEIISRLLPNKQVISNIDPVFLHDKQFWNNIAYSYNRNRKYVLIYSLANEAVSKSIKIAKEKFKNYEIYIIDDSVSKADPDVINIRGVGPRQFLGLIRDADYVITNSFHGCAFSIIFEKEFYVIPFKSTSSRMLNLLELVGLESRIVKSNLSIDNGMIDYGIVRSRIMHEINKSRAYLDTIYSV